MAQHGGLPHSMSAPPPPRQPLPTVHRPRLAMTSSVSTTLQQLPTSTLRRSQSSASTQTAVTSPVSEVTLTTPRPNAERAVNEYVETPFRPPTSGRKEAPSSVADKADEIIREVEIRTSTIRRDPIAIRRDPHHATLNLPIGRGNTDHRHATTRGGASAVINKQPGATATFTKNAYSDRSSNNPISHSDTAIGGECYHNKSIMCADCGRCRCESCRQPRALPSKWLCNNACLCSAETALDYVTCACVVKGLFYHCFDQRDLDRDSTACADSLCSCEPHQRVRRWGCLGLLALALPCLWCYWPLKGCVRLCELGYSRYCSSGCRCEPGPPKATDSTPEKPLLNTSPHY